MMLRCVLCGGEDSDGCEGCGGAGTVTITQCPREAITPDTYDFIRLADWADEKILPCGGGVLDQSAGFMDALRYFRNVQNELKADDGKTA